MAGRVRTTDQLLGFFAFAQCTDTGCYIPKLLGIVLALPSAPTPAAISPSFWELFFYSIQSYENMHTLTL
jgi:hypothetical protein